ncbi:MAG: hypothetical protein AB7G39_11390 [Alphaproteobacteria bacterium]
MPKLKHLACALALSAGLAAMPAAAQTAAAPAAQPAAGGFDAYRALAITTGIVVGAAVAIVITDGVIIPAYAYVTGTAVEAGAAAGAGAGAGAAGAEAGAAGGGMLHQMSASAMKFGHTGLGSIVGLLGGVAGGLYADSWYQGN